MTMFTVQSEPLPGAMVLQPRVFKDLRGTFVKTFHSDLFAELGISFSPQEEFFSISRKGVLRGMHFQLPPHDHHKLVYCVKGEVLDVIVDLRRSSPRFGQSASVALSEENQHVFFIPKGFAHGFLSLTDDSVMVYKTDHVYAPSSDTGVRWDSIGFDWPEPAPALSDRDLAFPPLEEFDSPWT